VTLTDAATKLSINTTTNGEGFYLFNDVRSGYYTVAAESTGFKKSEVRDVKVDVGVPATVNVHLEAGQIAEVVTTTASDSQALVNTENAQLTATIFAKQINDLPLNGRNPVQLASLQAGVASAGAPRLLQRRNWFGAQHHSRQPDPPKSGRRVGAAVRQWA